MLMALRTLVAFALLAPLAGAAPAVATITEYDIPPAGAAGSHAPRFVMAGSDGNLWFTDAGAQRGIGRVSPAGEFLPLIARTAAPIDISQGPSSVAWTEPAGMYERLQTGDIFPGWSAAGAGTVYAILKTPDNDTFWTGRQTSDSRSKLCSFPLADGFGDCRTGPVVATTPPTDVTLGPDGTLWVAGFESDSVHRYSTDELEELEVTFPAGSRPFRIASGPDGDLWVTSFGADAIDRVTPTGVRTRFPLPAGAAPKDIAGGPDGALWFTESGTASIGRITTDGAITHYPVPTSASSPWGIAAGPDGAIWFTENATGKIGRLVPDPPAGPPPPPSSDTTAPVFAGRLRAVPARFRVARRRPIESTRVPAGTTFRWALSEPATVTIRLQRRKGRRWVRAGQLRRQAAAGKNRLRFSGRIKRKALRRGRYRAVARAIDAAGNRSNPSRARFAIVQR